MTIKERRTRKDLSLGELARKCNLGTAVMSSIERGRVMPPDAVIADIATALECAPEEIRSAIPDPDEIARNAKRDADFLLVVATCKADAKAKGFGPGNAGRGEIDCPACSGKVRYSVTAVNGHMWGACSTPDCARWME